MLYVAISIVTAYTAICMGNLKLEFEEFETVRVDMLSERCLFGNFGGSLKCQCQCITVRVKAVSL